MNPVRWWAVRCTGCLWGNDRRGTHEQVTRVGCPKCGAGVTAGPGASPVGMSTVSGRADGSVA